MTEAGISTRLLGGIVRACRGVFGRYRRLDGSSLRRAVKLGIPLSLVAVCAVVASQGLGAATTQEAAFAGRAVTAGQLAQLETAARSCPALTPARLAGQIMAISGFDADAEVADGGEGIAGLTARDWQKWSPSPGAQRSDPAANVLALAHRMCDLVGRLREAHVGGDAWRNTLAASAAGVPAVVSAKGVPDGDPAQFVDMVTRYEGWYAQQPGFLAGASPRPGVPATATATATAQPSPGPPAAGTPAKPLPEGYLASVLAAGKICPTVTPARIAAQLMASSGFNSHVLGATGAQGVAQFLPEVWSRYAAPEMSPWEPTVAIPVLGKAMCHQVAALTGLGADPYASALTAFHWGPDAGRQTGRDAGPAGMREFATAVIGYADYYARDARLARPPASAPTRPATAPTAPTAAATAATAPKGPAAGPPPRPAPSPPPAPAPPPGSAPNTPLWPAPHAPTRRPGCWWSPCRTAAW
jgi:hypothetical protein